MKDFLYSSTMLYILAGLLVLTFFLPDIIGAVPSIIIGGMVICFALFVYDKWSSVADEPQNGDDDDS